MEHDEFCFDNENCALAGYYICVILRKRDVASRTDERERAAGRAAGALDAYCGCLDLCECSPSDATNAVVAAICGEGA